jgi:hypothetical protein
MGDDERRIDLALLDTFEKLRQIVLDRCLGHTEGSPRLMAEPIGILSSSPPYTPTIETGPEVTAAVDRLPQDMRTVRSP